MIGDIVLGAIVDAVFAYSVDKLDVAARVRSGLQLAPEKAAFKRALNKAITSLESENAEAVTILFDGSFMQNEASSLLARFLTRQTAPTGQDLAVAWADSLGLKGQLRDTQVRVISAAGDKFLADLREAIDAEHDLNNIGMSRDVHVMAQHTHAMAQDVGMIRQALQPADEELQRKIRFIIYAMTSTEAEELFSRRIFDDQKVRDYDRLVFNQFAELVGNDKLIEFQAHYTSDDRDEWLTHFPSTQSIKVVIEDMLGHMNDIGANFKSHRTLSPVFLSHDVFCDDQNARARTRRVEIHDTILVVDSISLLHPLLREKLIRSPFLHNHPIVVLSAVHASESPLDTFIMGDVGDDIQSALDRFNVDLDAKCVFGMNDLHALKRWIYSVLLHAPTHQAAHPEASQSMRNAFQSRGNIADRIFGGAQ